MVEKASVKPSHVHEGTLNPQNKKNLEVCHKGKIRPAWLIPLDSMVDSQCVACVPSGHALYFQCEIKLTVLPTGSGS